MQLFMNAPEMVSIGCKELDQMLSTYHGNGALCVTLIQRLDEMNHRFQTLDELIDALHLFITPT